jgi:hypothetical protein
MGVPSVLAPFGAMPAGALTAAALFLVLVLPPVPGRCLVIALVVVGAG